ncbi:membrane protein [Paenibacillus darwinianus]|uniref:Probable membrane transporter protein n=1 Tax=Paenibacillus darwinianus TaxID=1380763 RepID=A0A9W5RZC5_9BACL|nr:TSUP family transporter [Paenibacillus darwinianus]EXX86773.1 membrane protein [Paenibacillus darwinianus]EXX87085.1 membrane protein [Paenibacillus darwinianus]EXX87277.1 membrane protein [Paenibacillus darwinianus]
MTQLTIETILLVAVGGFIAAFIDSVVGGGGLISVPVLLAAGLPPHLALGTNKLASSMSSLTSTLSFMRSGYVNLRLTGRLLPLTLIGAVGGTVLLQQLPADRLRPLVVVLLVLVTAYTLLKKDWGSVSSFRLLTALSGVLIAAAALLLGAYDGFFGPGTGSFLIFAFLMLGFDFMQAAGSAKLLNFGSNIASLGAFAIFGMVEYRIGFIMGTAMVLGSLAGSRLAIRQGARYVRPLFIGISVVLIVRQVWTMTAG